MILITAVAVMLVFEIRNLKDLSSKEGQHSIDVKNRIFDTRFLIQNPDGPDILN
jgi:hypothetical protein